MKQLNLPKAAFDQQLRRVVFNLVGCNQDDHVKNIAFLMDKRGNWKLSPAYDITYSYNPTGRWTSSHQMTMNGKVDDFTLADFNQCGKASLLKQGRAKKIVEEVTQIVSQWKNYAREAEINADWLNQVSTHHRLNLLT